MMMIAMMILRKGDEHDHLTRDDKNHSGMIFLQTMYAGKYMNMYGLPGAGGTEQVP